MNQKRSRRFQFFVLLAAVTCAQAQNKELTRLRLAATETKGLGGGFPVFS